MEAAYPHRARRPSAQGLVDALPASLWHFSTAPLDEHQHAVRGGRSRAVEDTGHGRATLGAAACPTRRVTDDKISLLGAWVTRAARLITAELGGKADERLLAEP